MKFNSNTIYGLGILSVISLKVSTAIHRRCYPLVDNYITKEDGSLDSAVPFAIPDLEDRALWTNPSPNRWLAAGFEIRRH
jgi:hypothetical protein